VAQPINLGITGLATSLPGFKDLDDFDRAIFDGLCPAISSDSLNPNLAGQVAKQALTQSGIALSSKISILFLTESNTALTLPGFTGAAISKVATLSKAFETASQLLQTGAAQAVALVASSLDAAAALVIQQGNAREYAKIEGWGNSGDSAQAYRDACSSAGIQTNQIEYLEVAAGSEAAFGATERAYTCGLGGLPGESSRLAHLLGLIKVTLSLYHRYIPASPSFPSDTASWTNPAFYQAEESRPWFLESGANRRVAAFSGAQLYLLLSADANRPAPQNLYLTRLPLYFCPFAGENVPALLAQLQALKPLLASGAPLANLARQCFQKYRQNPVAAYALILVGQSREELITDLDNALENLEKSFAKGKEWKTTRGSYCTPNPLGKKGKVAFVYPGAFNSFHGLGQTLFHLFPGLQDSFGALTSNVGLALGEKKLYPRSLSPLDKAQIEALEKELEADSQTLIESGASFAILFTMIMRDYFKVRPQIAFGYSMGETSMFWALGVWTGGDKGLDAFHQSPLFQTRLTGPKDAIREQWQIKGDRTDDTFWSNYYLLTPLEKIRAGLEGENRVYLTHINTPEEGLIAGDSEACRRVIAKVKAHNLKSPSSFVLHCEPTTSEYNELLQLHSHPTRQVEGVTFYSAANYAPVKLERAEIAQSVARMVCNPLDFPRLVSRVYEDGARLFVELGPGSTCSRWVGKILGKKEHARLNISQKGTSDHTSLLKLLAQLVSHRVELDLSPLYEQKQETNNLHQQLDRLLINNSSIAETQRALLNSRREGLEQLGGLISLQLKLLQDARNAGTLHAVAKKPSAVVAPISRPALFDETKIEEFATGSAAKCFGAEYNIYEGRRLSRIPNGDLKFMSRVTEITGEKKDFDHPSSITVEYDVPDAPWFYQQNAAPYVPYCVVMEIALQPCGFLSAYKGSALMFPNTDLYFRNLDGTAELVQNLDVRGKTVTTRATLLATSAFDGTIIQRFRFESSCEGQTYYRGESAFGFFSREVMANQVGLDGGKEVFPWLNQQPAAMLDLRTQPEWFSGNASKPAFRLSGGQLDFLDEIKIVPNGGKYNKGYIFANRKINPADWFYTCHFYQDPVMPGSLGVEAILEAMQAYALQQNLGAGFRAPRFTLVPGSNTTWKYRGQLGPQNELLRLEVHITEIVENQGQVIINADASLWKDKLRIYEIKQIALNIIEA